MLSKGAMPKSSACTSGCVGGGPTPFLVTPTLSFVEMGCANISVIPSTTFLLPAFKIAEVGEAEGKLPY